MNFKNEILNLFETAQKENQNSLDDAISACHKMFCESPLASEPELNFMVADIDAFRHLIFDVSGIDEYEYYTKHVDKGLKKYVEENIYPEYNKNDLAHGALHVRDVVCRAFALNETLNLCLDKNMIYAMASYHDLGKYIDHETHEKIAAQKFIEDDNMKKFLFDDQRKIVMEAIQDHRSSFGDTPRSNYGKLISSADRNTRIENVIIRSFFVGQWRTPDMTVEEFLDFTFKRLSKRYGVENPENMFFADETYTNFLGSMRELLKDEKAFKERYCKVNNLTDMQARLSEEAGRVIK